MEEVITVQYSKKKKKKKNLASRIASKPNSRWMKISANPCIKL